MKTVIKFRWPILIFWVAAAILLTVFMPDVNKIIVEKGQGAIGSQYSSKIAEKLVTQMAGTKGTDAVLVFTDAKGLDENKMSDIKAGLEQLKKKKDAIGISEILNSFDTPEAKDRLVSRDNTTVIASITYSRNGREIGTVRKEILDSLKDVKAEHYLTGSEFISRDFLDATFAGVDKSAVITIVFILIVLFLVFRSLITPVASLITVGASYLVSYGIVGQLIHNFGFPVTSLTQMFIIMVLFGIGTDYNILLFNRFKEELALHDSVDDAIRATYRTAGRTVILSGLTIFIAFASLSFSEFDVYRSGNAVAIAILILFAEIMTLTPLFMKVFGQKLFWPSHNTKGHKESRFWEKVSGATVRHPVFTILGVILIMVPVFYFYNQNLSFDNLKEMSSSYASVKGFNTVSDHFGKGTSMPSSVVLSNDIAMDNNDSLAVIDKLTEKIKAVEGVRDVYGPTRPKGVPVDEFYTGSQTKSVVDGLSSANDGIGDIYDGLKKMQDKLSVPDFSQVNDLVKGTGDVHTGMLKLNDGIKQVETGIGKGAAGAGSIKAGITSIKENLTKVSASTKQLAAAYDQLQSGYAAFGKGYTDITAQLTQMQQAMAGMQGMAEKLGATYPDMAKDTTFLTLKATLKQVSDGMNQMVAGLQVLNTKYAAAGEGFLRSNAGLQALGGGMDQMVQGLTRLESGAASLETGLKQGAAGQKTVSANMEKLTDGLEKIKGGQDKLTQGLSGFGSGIGTLKDGLGASADGLKKVSEGLDKVNTYLGQLTASRTFFIPGEALNNKDFKKSLDAYMSEDRKIVKLTVILNDDPYSPQAIKTIARINTTTAETLKGTVLSKAKYGSGGESSRTNDLKHIAVSDITTTRIVVLIGVFIVLLFVIRRFWISVYIIAALLAAYYTAMTVTGAIVTHVFKLDGLAWNVPFFAFIIIVALGVDYSIFLMMRLKEYEGLPQKEAIVKAAKNVGGVVVSAAIILMGTFLTLYPSGIQTLMQIAVSAAVGIIMIAFVLLPAALPAMISLPDVLQGRNRKQGQEVPFK